MLVIAAVYDLVPGDHVMLNSGGPPMTVIEINTPGRNDDIANTADVVVWWRRTNGSPQIATFDTRQVLPIAAPTFNDRALVEQLIDRRQTLAEREIAKPTPRRSQARARARSRHLP